MILIKIPARPNRNSISVAYSVRVSDTYDIFVYSSLFLYFFLFVFTPSSEIVSLP